MNDTERSVDSMQGECAVNHWKRIIASLELATSLAAVVVIGGCAHKVDVQPIKVEPIHMTVDINIKVDRELDRFFDYEDENLTPSTQPSGVPAAPTPPLNSGADEGGA